MKTRLIDVLKSVFFAFRAESGSKKTEKERHRDREERDARILGALATARQRLSVLKIADEEVARALDRLVSAAGTYLEVSVRGAQRRSEAEDAMFGAVEAVDEYLRMENVERGEARSASAERTARALNAAAVFMEKTSLTVHPS